MFSRKYWPCSRPCRDRPHSEHNWAISSYTADAISDHRQISNIRRTKSQTLNVSRLVLQLALYWRQVLGQIWRCSWSSADRRCSNYIWVITNFIVYKGAVYIRSLTVHMQRVYMLTGDLLGASSDGSCCRMALFHQNIHKAFVMKLLIHALSPTREVRYGHFCGLLFWPISYPH